MSTGISTLACRLDSDVPAAEGGVDWNDLVTFLAGTRPAFAGKYFTASPWRWVHGEATSLVDPAVPGARLLVAPIAASDPVRQAQTGNLGMDWGYEDGHATAKAIQAALQVGSLALPSSSRVYVYLEVAVGTALSPEYWSMWATAITQAVLIGDATGAFLIPVLQGLLPCISTPFIATAGTFGPPPNVVNALETSIPKFVFSRALCNGFWASTGEPAAIAPAPAPAWPAFKPYSQPQSSSPVRVPVRLWRYAAGDPAAPVHGVGRISLDFTAVPSGQPDAALDGMLTVKPWTAANRPTQTGVDRGTSVATQVRCLTTHNIRVDHLPQKRDAGFFEGPALVPALEAPVSFVIRYSSAGPRMGGAAPLPPLVIGKDLSRREAELLADRGVDVVTVFQTRRTTYDHIPADLANPANGESDGFAAGWFSANVIRQPPHTPIYFAIDTDVNTTGISTIEGPHCITPAVLVAYFRAVKRGMDRYLTSADPEMRVPYAIGAYACSRACETLYREGLATHFWQAFPPFWGDDVLNARTNGVVFKRANIWQVAGESFNAVMVSSGLNRCRGGFPWVIQHKVAGGPEFIDIQINGGAIKRLPIPTTAAALAVATGAQVRDSVRDGVQQYDLLFAVDPVTVDIGVAGVLPPGFDPLTWGSIVERKGVHDLDVAWGDPGGWRPKDGVP